MNNIDNLSQALQLAQHGDAEAVQRGYALLTKLLDEAEAGGEDARLALYPLIEPVLRKVADDVKTAIGRGPTVKGTQTSVLINEAFNRLLTQGFKDWPDRKKLYAFASKIMHDLLIDAIRRTRPDEAAGGAPRMPVDRADTLGLLRARWHDLDFQLDLKEALAGLQKVDRDASIIFRLRWLFGFQFDEIAEVMGIHPASVVRRHTDAIAWLRRALKNYDAAS